MLHRIGEADATVVIPQFDRAELTCACIESLRRQEPIRWPVIVVDDGSSPGCADAVMARGFLDTTVIRQPHTGVTAAWNLGAAHATTPLIVFLNNDVLFMDSAIERLISCLRQGAALVSGAAWRRERLLPHRVLRRLSTDRFLQGWCLAVSAETLRAIGGFDESMKVYWSDTDFQVRVLRAAGDPQALVCRSDLPLHHLGHRTAHRLPNRCAAWRADRAAFIAKWSGR